jgi:hypothetical protein
LGSAGIWALQGINHGRIAIVRELVGPANYVGGEIMAKIWSRKVTLPVEIQGKVDEYAKMNVAKVAQNLCISTDVTETAKRAGLSVSTTHDNIKRLTRDYDVSVLIYIEKKKDKVKASS